MTAEHSQADQPLAALGERRIIAELIKPIFTRSGNVIRGIGDDTAALQVTPGCELLVTTDPCPVPVVAILGDDDLWHWGRLTHVISLSDLAASGAKPLGMVVSTIMPEGMSVARYVRYLEALEHYAQIWGCPVIGGNIKDGDEFSSCSTALGEAPIGWSMTRSGMRPLDAVYVVGSIGHFWSAVLTRMNSWNDIEASYSAIFQKALYEPTPRVAEGQVLGESRRVSACIDASDGLGAALEQLVTANGYNIVIDQSLFDIEPCVRDVANRRGLHPLALALAWGDWQLVFSGRQEDVEVLADKIRSLGSPCQLIGYVDSAAGDGLITKTASGEFRQIRSFASERFRESSYFTHGLESYVHLLELGPYLDSCSVQIR